MRRLLIGLVIAALAIGATLTGLALALESAWFAQFVARQASGRLDRQVTIAGPLAFDWALRPRLHIPTLTIANADWAGSEPLARIAGAQLTLDLARLLGGQLVIANLLLHAPQLDLQRLKDGRSNWQELLGGDSSGKPARVIVDTVRIRDGRLRLDDASQALLLDITIETVAAGAGPELLHVAGRGSRRGHGFELDLRGGPLLAVTDPERPYPVAGTLRAGGTRLQGAGELLRPAAPARGAFTLTLQGPNPADLHQLLGLALPDLPPYRLTGRLLFEQGHWHFRDFDGRVGDSDLTGNLVIRPGRPLVLDAELASRQLDLDDLLPALGAAPASDVGETAAAGQRQQAQARRQAPDVLPEAPADRDRLLGVKARVRFRGERVAAPRQIPLQQVDFTLELADGVLRFQPLTFALGGGRVRSRLALDTRRQPVQGRLEAHIQDVDLSELLGGFGVPRGGFGTIRGRLDARFAGDSLAQAAASSDGGLLLYMTSGEIDAVLVSLAGLDAGRALMKRLFGSGPTRIECAFGHLEARDGLATLERFLIATEDIDLTAAGTVNLRQETFDIALRGYPRSPSVGASDAPVHLGGKFAAADVSVMSKELVARGALAALAALVAPPLAIAPFLNPGSGDEKEDVCSRLSREASRIELGSAPVDAAAAAGRRARRD